MESPHHGLVACKVLRTPGLLKSSPWSHSRSTSNAFQLGQEVRKNHPNTRNKRRQAGVAGQPCAHTVFTQTHGSSHWSQRHMAAYIGFKYGKARALWSHAVLTGIRTAITVWERPGLGAGLRHSLTLLSSHNDTHPRPQQAHTGKGGLLLGTCLLL